MVKKQIMDKEIKELIENKNLIIGTKRTMRYLKLGKIEKIYLSSNCKEDIKADLEYYTKITPIQIIQLKYPNDELGILCKKPFPISVLSILKVGTK